MSEASIKRSHIGASGREEAATDVVVHAAIINSVDTAQLNKVRLAGDTQNKTSCRLFCVCRREPLGGSSFEVVAPGGGVQPGAQHV